MADGSGSILLYFQKALKYQISVFDKSSEYILWIRLKMVPLATGLIFLFAGSAVILKTPIM